jgi:hypothetical protein
MSYGVSAADAYRQVGIYTGCPQGRETRGPAGQLVRKLELLHAQTANARPHQPQTLLVAADDQQNKRCFCCGA